MQTSAFSVGRKCFSRLVGKSIDQRDGEEKRENDEENRNKGNVVIEDGSYDNKDVKMKEKESDIKVKSDIVGRVTDTNRMVKKVTLNKVNGKRNGLKKVKAANKNLENMNGNSTIKKDQTADKKRNDSYRGNDTNVKSKSNNSCNANDNGRRDRRRKSLTDDSRCGSNSSLTSRSRCRRWRRSSKSFSATMNDSRCGLEAHLLGSPVEVSRKASWKRSVNWRKRLKIKAEFRRIWDEVAEVMPKHLSLAVA